MSATARPDGRDLPVDDLQDLAKIERLLRRDTRAHNPRIDIGREGARIAFESSRLNQHARGSLTASVVSEVVHTAAWGLATVYDPFGVDDSPNVETMLMVLHDPPEERR